MASQQRQQSYSILPLQLVEHHFDGHFRKYVWILDNVNFFEHHQPLLEAMIQITCTTDNQRKKKVHQNAGETKKLWAFERNQGNLYFLQCTIPLKLPR